MNDIDNQEAKCIFKTCIANNDVDEFRVFLDHMPQYAALALKLCVKNNNTECAIIALSHRSHTLQEQIDKSLSDAAHGNNLAMVELLFGYISPNFECNSALFFAAMNGNLEIMNVVWGRSNVDTVIVALNHLGVRESEKAIETLQTLRDQKQAAAQKQHLEEALLITPEALVKRQRLDDQAILTKKM